MNIRKVSLQMVFLAGCAFIGLQACKHQPVDPVPPITPPDTIPIGGGGGGCHPDTVYFYNTILPIIESNCAYGGCHDAVTKPKGVILIDYQNIWKTADVDEDDPEDSKLYRMITEDERDEWMPKGKPKLADSVIKLIYDWIDQGALDNRCVDECDTTNVTYSKTVSGIFNLKCVSCHKAGNVSGGIRLDNYYEATVAGASGKVMPAILHQNVSSKNMPQGLPQLDSCKINAIRVWIETGMPE